MSAYHIYIKKKTILTPFLGFYRLQSECIYNIKLPQGKTQCGCIPVGESNHFVEEFTGQAQCTQIDHVLNVLPTFS